jgi:beta-glucosidase
MKESVRQSVEAGLNVRCTFRSPDSYVLPLRELVNEGTISMDTIDERVSDILRVKFLVGLFDKPYQTDFETADLLINGEEHNKVALRASQECLVLLKNKKNVLPLKQGTKVYITGPSADNARAQCGGWTIDWNGSTEVDIEGVTTIQDAFESGEYDIRKGDPPLYHQTPSHI